MKTLSRLTAAGLLFALTIPAAAQQREGSAEEGARLYESYGCYQCHQYSGSGYLGIPGGAPLVPMRFPLQAFIAYIRNPSVPSRMPPYTAKVLSDEQAADIHAYIQSLPEPEDKADIPLLNSIIREIEQGE